MLATLLELLGGREVESWGSRVAEDEVGGERREELPSEMDEKEFKMLMMQVGSLIDVFERFMSCDFGCCRLFRVMLHR
jgi:hypothetical protein